MRNLKVLRTGFAVVVMIFASIGAKAIPCDEAWDNYLAAQFGYESARLSYFYGIPESCEQECWNSQDYWPCVEQCRINRYTALGQADIAMFSLALDTCTPITVDECASARAIANNCFAQFDPSCYSDPNEAAAVAEERWACWEASKVDYCQ